MSEKVKLSEVIAKFDRLNEKLRTEAVRLGVKYGPEAKAIVLEAADAMCGEFATFLEGIAADERGKPRLKIHEGNDNA